MRFAKAPIAWPDPFRPEFSAYVAPNSRASPRNHRPCARAEVFCFARFQLFTPQARTITCPDVSAVERFTLRTFALAIER